MWAQNRVISLGLTVVQTSSTFISITEERPFEKSNFQEEERPGNSPSRLDKASVTSSNSSLSHSRHAKLLKYSFLRVWPMYMT